MTHLNQLGTFLGHDEFQAFLQSFRDKRRLHVPALDRSRFDPLLPWAEINRFVEGTGVDTGRLKIIRDGQTVPTTWYTAAGRLRVGALLQMAKTGVSIGWDHVTNDLPAVADLCANLERRLRSRVWANAYLSFRKGGAFKIHYDAHDVLVLQIHGGKRWTTYGTPVAAAVKPYAAPAVRPEAEWTGEVHAGDLLFVPRGEVHSAEVIGEHSVHLTIGIQRVRGLEFAAWLAHGCDSEELLRTDIPDEQDVEAFQDYEQRLKQALIAKVQSADILSFLSVDHQERRMLPRIRLQDAFAPIPFEGVIVPTLCRPVSSSPLGSGTLRAGGQDFRLTPSALKLLAVITNSETTRLEHAAAACGLPPDEAQAALTLLLENGLVALQDTASAATEAEGNLLPELLRAGTVLTSP